MTICAWCKKPIDMANCKERFRQKVKRNLRLGLPTFCEAQRCGTAWFRWKRDLERYGTRRVA